MHVKEEKTKTPNKTKYSSSFCLCVLLSDSFYLYVFHSKSNAISSQTRSAYAKFWPLPPHTLPSFFFFKSLFCASNFCTRPTHATPTPLNARFPHPQPLKNIPSPPPSLFSLSAVPHRGCEAGAATGWSRGGRHSCSRLGRTAKSRAGPVGF